MKWRYGIGLGLAFLTVAVFGVWLAQTRDTNPPPVADETQTQNDETMSQDEQATGDESPDQEPESPEVTASDVSVEPLKHSLDEPDSLWVIVNKERPIPLTYTPQNLRVPDVPKRESNMLLRDTAASALERMFSAAESANIDLILASAYRDADLQASIYNNYVATYGQAEANRFSARPGTSEHQTGLAADVSASDYECYLETCFADTPEGQWVANNAHRFGYIIRYPRGKEAITGYQFEPWHLRYVGNELAEEVFESSQTLEEYFGL